MNALSTGHRRSLECLADTTAALETLRRYREALPGVGIYLRPTASGLKVISLDWERCASMIGVGGRRTNEHVLRSLPPSEDFVRRASEGYVGKRDSLVRRSEEERFALRCISHALSHDLRLAGTDWLFLHQEWRLPTTTSSGKVDLLAVDRPSGRLVVIECKNSPRHASRRDPSGRDAENQASHYAEVILEHAGELGPFFTDLHRAMASIYGAEPAPVDASRLPLTAVWWPGRPAP